MPDHCSSMGCERTAQQQTPIWLEEKSGYRGYLWIWLCEFHCAVRDTFSSPEGPFAFRLRIPMERWAA